MAVVTRDFSLRDVDARVMGEFLFPQHRADFLWRCTYDRIMRISYSMLSWRIYENFSILRQLWGIFRFHDDTRSDHGISYFYIGWRILEDSAWFVSCSMAIDVDVRVVQIFFYLWRMYDIFYSGLVTRTRIATRAFFYILRWLSWGFFYTMTGEKFYATSFLLRGDTNAWEFPTLASWRARLYHEDFSVLYRAVIMAGDFLFYGEWRDVRVMGNFLFYRHGRMRRANFLLCGDTHVTGSWEFLILC